MAIRKATVDDFVQAFTELETVELSELNDAGNTIVSDDAIQFALDDADLTIQSYFVRCALLGRVMIGKAWRRLQLRLARQSLDIFKDRPGVRQDADNAIAFLQSALLTKANDAVNQADLDELELTSAANSPVIASANPRVFTRTTLAGYRHDKLYYY